MLNYTRIPAPRVTIVDPQTGIVSNEWFRFFNNLYAIAYAATGSVTPGTYGSATAVPQITVDDFGTITGISNVPIAIDASQIVSGTIASARISGAYTGITGVGTLTVGTWNATAITTPYGGTGLTSYTAGDTLYYASGTALAKLAIGASTFINTSSGTAPQWTNPSTITIGKATNLVGGAANRIAYQTATDTTGFIVAPTVSNTYLNWSGSAYQWSSNPLGDVIGPASATDNAIARFDTTTGKLIQNSTVTISDNGDIENVNAIGFDITPTTLPTAQGTLYWDNADSIQTLSLVMEGGNAVQQIGEEQYYRIKCSAAVTEGQVIMFTGTVGASGGLTGAPATGLTASTASYVMGVATESGALNDWIYVTSFGLVRGINTTGGAEAWVDGEILYYNPAVAGGLTKTLPTAPNAKVQVCAVVHAASNGSLFIRPTFGGILGQYEGDVNFTSTAAGNLIRRNAGNTAWENVATIPNTNLANSSITINGVAVSLGGSTSVGTVTSVSGTGSVNGITLTGTVTSSGSLTLGGTLSGIGNSQLTNSTISGVALGGNLFNLTAGTGVSFSTGTTYNGSAAITINATGTGGTVTSVAASVPSFLSISGSPITTSGTLAITLSGTALPVANGGTGSTTAFTAGSVVFAGASGDYSQKNANFFWDNTNNRLGIGTASPVKTFSVSNSDQNQARIRIDNTSGRIYDIVSGVNGLLQSGFSIFDATASATRFTIFASGGISIGNTTDPGATNLSVNGRIGVGNASPACSVDASGMIRAQGATITAAGVGAEFIYTTTGWSATAGTLIQAYNRATSTYLPTSIAASAIYFATGATIGQKAVIDTNGRLGIGTTAPQQLLNVENSGSYQVRLGFTTNNTNPTFSYDIGRSSSDGYFRFYGNQTATTGYIFTGIDGERLRIDLNGNVYGTSGTTGMTNGFFYIPSAAGAPSGTPTAVTGRVPMYYDTTNNFFYVYNGAWKRILLS